MPWIKLDDNFAEHPKVLAVSDGAFRLHVRAMGYASRLLTDGDVSASALYALKPGRRGERLAEELVAAGIWERHGKAWRIHDYLHYQPSKEHVLEVRKERATSGKRGGEARAEQMSGKRKASA